MLDDCISVFIHRNDTEPMFLQKPNVFVLWVIKISFQGASLVDSYGEVKVAYFMSRTLQTARIQIILNLYSYNLEAPDLEKKSRPPHNSVMNSLIYLDTIVPIARLAER